MTIALRDPLASLLPDASFFSATEVVADNAIRVTFGSAMVLVGTQGTAIIAVAPMFRRLPTGNQAEFCAALLGYNSEMGGVAAFAIQKDGWVVLHAARPLSGIDRNEFAMLVTAVGRLADHYDDVLDQAYYGGKGRRAEGASNAPGAEAPQAPTASEA